MHVLFVCCKMIVLSVAEQIILKYRVFQKEFYNCIPNVAVWRVLRKRLRLKAYKLYIVQRLYPLLIRASIDFVCTSAVRTASILELCARLQRHDIHGVC
jgi:hypothetical protein